jgi:hypothetical protein
MKDMARLPRVRPPGFPLLAAAALAGLVSPGTARGDTARQHDGFFLRVGLGGSSLGMRREGRVGLGTPKYYTGESTIAGRTGAFELSIGGALAPGVVLAGTFASDRLSEPTLDQGSSSTRLPGPLTFARLGIAMDWYPDPRGGLHLGAGASLAGAWVKSPPPAFTEYLGGGGGALSAHVGYGFWVGEQWSLAALLRATGARLRGETTQLGITGREDDTVKSLSLLIGAVFN